MSTGLTAGFALQHARQIQAMLDEVNSEPPARIAVAGAAEPLAALTKALAGDSQGAVTALDWRGPDHELDEYTALVVVIDSWPLDEAAVGLLRVAERASVPIVAVLVGTDEAARRDEVPYVLATDVILADAAGEAAVPVVERIAARAKGDAYRVARALPHFTDPVSKMIIRHYSRLNGLVGAAAIIPGADLPVLTLNQLRMVARLAGAQGIELDAKRLIELAVVVGASLGLRGVARTALGLLPGPGRAIKGGVALSGTTAIGEAALRRFRAESGAVGTGC
ncbi:MAG: hypothetical protein ACR2OD_03140 [Gaiellaceae bacterium]